RPAAYTVGSLPVSSRSAPLSSASTVRPRACCCQPANPLPSYSSTTFVFTFYLLLSTGLAARVSPPALRATSPQAGRRLNQLARLSPSAPRHRGAGPCGRFACSHPAVPTVAAAGSRTTAPPPLASRFPR